MMLFVYFALAFGIAVAVFVGAVLAWSFALLWRDRRAGAHRP